MSTGGARPLLPWLITAAVLAAVVGLVAVTGGWADAGEARGRPVAAGTRVDLERWQVRVMSAELRDRDPQLDYETPDTLVVRLWLLNTTDTTLSSPESGLIQVVTGIAEQPEYDGFRATTGRTLSLDPGTAQEVELALTYPENASPAAPDQVVVLLHDERLDENLSGSPYWRITGRVAQVRLPLTDRRTDG